MKVEPLRVMYVDNDPMAAGAFEVLVEGIEGIELIPFTGRSDDLADFYEASRPDVVMIDLYLDPRDGDGLVVAALLAAEHPDAVPLICTSSESPADSARVWAAGVRAYLTKRALLADIAKLPAVVRAVLDGQVIFHVDPRAGGAVVTPSPLSERELEVLQCKVNGETHRHIANKLCLSVRTIDSHLANIRAKLEAPSVQDMLRVAVERGLVDDSA